MESVFKIKVSLVVPVRNGEKTIIALLKSIYSGSRCPDEVVLIDQSDNESTQNVIDDYIKLNKRNCIRYIRSPRRGLCVNRNDCIKAAKYEFIIFVDQDMTVDYRWLELIVDEWVAKWDKKLVVISGRTLPGDQFKPTDLVPSIQESNERKVYRKRSKSAEVLYGAHFAASKDLFMSLKPKPFDERLGVGTKFPGADDNDFAYRVIRAGYPIVFEPKILAYHHPEPRSWRKMRYDYSIGYGAYMSKYLLEGDIIMIIDIFRCLIGNIAKGFRSLIKLQEPEGSARLLANLGLVNGFVRWIFYQKRGR
jgi:glycosyltransferase involved in cell wall biosynthesis